MQNFHTLEVKFKMGWRLRLHEFLFSKFPIANNQDNQLPKCSVPKIEHAPRIEVFAYRTTETPFSANNERALLVQTGQTILARIGVSV